MGLPDRKWAKALLDNTSRGLLILHVVLAIYYGSYSVSLLALINLLCAIASMIGLSLLKKGQVRAQLLLLYLAELSHVAASAILLGWSAGFQLPLIGLTALLFLWEYFGRLLKLPFLPALPFGLANFGIYAAAFPPFFHKPGLLAAQQSTVFTVQLIWGGLVFALFLGGLVAAMNMTSASQYTLTSKAETDELTGLINRAGYDRLLSELPLDDTILLLVDTDKFKVLKKIAKSLLANFRQNDYVCRIGGDEFAVLMLSIGTIEDEKLREKIRYINRELAASAADELPTVSVSVGVARGTGAENWTELFKQADSELYKVKQDGGRGCRIYTPKLQ